MLYYAENIKKIRKRKKVTQSELAEGIASQGMISKIEKKQISPDVDLLQAIAEKLDCSLMDLVLENKENGLSQTYSYINKLIDKREYTLLEQCIKTDLRVKTMKQANESFYKWVNGIILSQNYHQYQEGIKEMVEAVNLSLNDSLKIRILVGLSGLYSEIQQFEKSLNSLLEATTLSEKVTVDNQLKQSINFQLARVYSVLEQFEDSIFYNRIAIQYTIGEESLYLLDDLYLLLADSYFRTGKMHEAHKYVQLASAVAEIRTNTQLIPYIERTQSKIENQL